MIRHANSSLLGVATLWRHRCLVTLQVVAAVAGLWHRRAQAQEAFTDGAFVGYVGVGANGELLADVNGTPGNVGDDLSMRYSESGTLPTAGGNITLPIDSADSTCDTFRRGTPIEAFSVQADQFGVVTNQAADAPQIVTVPGGATTKDDINRVITWAGRYDDLATSAAVQVSQTVSFADPTQRYVIVRVEIRNVGSVDLTNLYYTRMGDPDHGFCGSGDLSTWNDVRFQPSPGVNPFQAALVNAGAATMSGGRNVLGVGTFDTRVRVEARPIINPGNPPPSISWNAPQDPDGLKSDVPVLLTMREETLVVGASTSFSFAYVWGPDEATVEQRLLEIFCFLVGPGVTCDDGQFCTVDDVCQANGSCAGTARDCSSVVSGIEACTVDLACNEATNACEFNVAPGSCAISGQCVAEGDTAPGDICLICDPARSQTSYVLNESEPSCLVDAGTPDGGTPDGGTPDGGTPDGGTADGGGPGPTPIPPPDADLGDGGLDPDAAADGAADGSITDQGLEVRGSSYLCTAHPLRGAGAGLGWLPLCVGLALLWRRLHARRRRV
ncbi:MAG: hypothetical protein ACPGUV_01150 [Polyangiales bacterium]